MKILLDHNVPKRLRNAWSDLEIKTAKEMAWAELENGALLRAAEDDGFQLMVTCDQNLSYQQNLKGRSLAIIVLSTNNLNILRRNLRQIRTTMDRAKPGSFETVFCE